jgi:hypothetical protein
MNNLKTPGKYKSCSSCLPGVGKKDKAPWKWGPQPKLTAYEKNVY